MYERMRQRQSSSSDARESLHLSFLNSGYSRASDERRVLCALRDAEMTDTQLVPWGSNYTFAAAMQLEDGTSFPAIYKPEQGEAPLWDFESGTLYRREFASYLVSRCLGWRFVPPTVIRHGPYGVGTVQLYIEPAKTGRERDWRLHRDQLQQIALFDLITNNADRKGGHFFLGRYQPQVWGIDHGLTFHVNPKLRTVLWDFCGEPVDPRLTRALRRIERRQEMLLALLRPYLSIDEILMVMVRVERVLQTGTFPMLNPRRNIPYGW
jgi:hypothetical protein